MKKGKVKKFFEWFLEEEKFDESKANEEDAIEINFFHAVIIIAFTVFFLFWTFKPYLKDFFVITALTTQHKMEKNYFRAVLTPQQYIDYKIEKNYFKEEGALKNGNFSQGLEHWVSSDGGNIFPESKSIIELEEKVYHSPPYSIRIESKNPANRIHYSKKKNNHKLNNAYGFKETDHWLGVLPYSHVRVSLWYRGDVPRVAVIGLSYNGDWSNLITSSAARTDEWKRVEVSADIPKSIRAIALEITLNRTEGMPLPVIWIDDVNIEVQNHEKQNK